jgi:outer membrane protein insertion porin family
MASKRGFTLVFVGLAFGIAVGFGIRALKSRIASELIAMLDAEAASSAGCKFVADSVDISLIQQRAVAIQPRIECSDGQHLVFERIIADFSLSRIRQRIIDLELHLIRGETKGFFANSTTFKFIDSLAAPIAPERDTPDRYKVKLQRLRVSELKGADTYGALSVAASGATLEMARTPSNDFVLLPKIPTATLTRGPQRIEVANLSTSLELRDEELDFRNIIAAVGATEVRGGLTLTNDARGLLDGTLVWSGDIAQLVPSTAGTFSSEMKISGAAAAPLIEGKVGTETLAIAGLAASEQLAAKFSLSERGDFTVSDLHLGVPAAALQLTQPFMIRDTGAGSVMTGALAVAFRAPYAGALSATISGDTSAPKLSVEGRAALQRDLNSSAQLTVSIANLVTSPEFSGSGRIALSGMPPIDLKLNSVSRAGVELAVTTVDKSLTGLARVNAADGSGGLELAVSPTLIDQLVPCGNLKGAITYRWGAGAASSGSGMVALDALAAGCGLGTARLSAPVQLPITGGTLNLAGIKILSLEKPFSITGTASLDRGLNLKAAGAVDLTTLRSLVPNMDEVSGLADGEITVTGPLAAPVLAGSIQVKNLRVENANAGLELSKVSGPIAIINNRIALKDIEGNLNGGSVRLNGEIDLRNLANSSAKVVAQGVAFEPSPQLSGLLSGEVMIDQAGALPRLSGNVSIDSGEFADSLTLSQIPRLIERALLAQKSQAKSPTLPDVKLDLKITANRNVVVNTNLGAAELSAALAVEGNLKEPAVRGTVEIRSGWIGFQNRRFEISSGRLTFGPPGLEPSIDLTAETILPARTGENVLVVLSGRGKLSSPTISLSSDQPISERELLALVSAGAGFSSRTRASTIGDRKLTSETPLLADLMSFRLRSFFSQLVDVDSLAIAPLFNPRTGLIEPALVAEKLLAESLTLFGESTLSGVAGISRARLQYDLTDDFALGALVEEDPSQNSVPAEIQFSYTPLSPRSRRVSFAFEGNTQISDKEILAGLKLSNTSLVNPGDIETLSKRLKELYERRGFPDASMKLSCESFSGTCTKVALNIEEGAARTVAEAILSSPSSEQPLGQALTERLAKIASQIAKNARASEQVRIETSLALIRTLRSEGYIGARVETAYRCDTGSTCVLDLQLTPGRPISFVFTGNREFSAAQFLDAIRLFQRPQPFGNNTISILTATIERMYRERGLLFATVSYEAREADDSSGRTVFAIQIDEGPLVAVASVAIEGIDEPQRAELSEKLSSDDYESVFKPRFPVAEQVDENAGIVTAALNELGYLGAETAGRIDPIGDSNTALISYQVMLGERSERVSPLIVNWPPEVPVPEELREQDFIESLPARSARLVEFLKQEGFVSASSSQWSHSNAEPGTIRFEPGPRTTITTISVVGNQSSDQRIIREVSELEVGAPLARSTLDDARRRVLKLGLFSKVGVTGSEDGTVTIEVLERPARSLEFGSGANSEFGLHLFGEATDRGLFGDGRQLALRLDGYYDASQSTISKGTASAQFRVPFVFGSDLALSEDVRFQRFDLATLPYDLDRWSIASFLSGESDSLSYSFGHSLIADKLDAVDPDAVLGEFDTGSVRLGMLSGTISFDTRDAPLNPEAGYLLALDAKIAASAVGSEANFLELSPRFSWTTALEPQWSFAYQLRAGAREPFSGTDEIPITQRYFIGGRSSVRGYKENSLGPRGALGSSQGGRYLLNQNAEFRYKPVEAVAVLWFVDSGSVFIDSISADDLRHSTGVGFRYLSPVGPIGFDVGFPIARKAGEDAYRIHFSIGTIF